LKFLKRVFLVHLETLLENGKLVFVRVWPVRVPIAKLCSVVVAFWNKLQIIWVKVAVFGAVAFGLLWVNHFLSPVNHGLWFINYLDSLITRCLTKGSWNQRKLLLRLFSFLFLHLLCDGPNGPRTKEGRNYSKWWKLINLIKW